MAKRIWTIAVFVVVFWLIGSAIASFQVVLGLAAMLGLTAILVWIAGKMVKGIGLIPFILVVVVLYSLGKGRVTATFLSMLAMGGCYQASPPPAPAAPTANHQQGPQIEQPLNNQTTQTLLQKIESLKQNLAEAKKEASSATSKATEEQLRKVAEAAVTETIKISTASANAAADQEIAKLKKEILHNQEVIRWQKNILEVLCEDLKISVPKYGDTTKKTLVTFQCLPGRYRFSFRWDGANEPFQTTDDLQGGGRGFTNTGESIELYLGRYWMDVDFNGRRAFSTQIRVLHTRDSFWVESSDDSTVFPREGHNDPQNFILVWGKGVTAKRQ